MQICQNSKTDWTVITKTKNITEIKLHLMSFIILLSNLDYDNVSCRIRSRQLSNYNLTAILLSHPAVMKKLTLSLLYEAKQQFLAKELTPHWTTIVTNYRNCGFIKYTVWQEVYLSGCTLISVRFEENQYL